MQRVPMAEFAPDLQMRLESLWGDPPNLYRALGNQPALVAAWTEFFNSIRNQSRTPRRLREIVILRAGQLARSEYEWAQHLSMARKAGVRDTQIQALSDWRASKEFDARERAALALTEAVTAGQMTDEVHAEAKRHFDDGEFVELCLTAAAYAMVSRMIDALGIELDPGVKDYSPRLP